MLALFDIDAPKRFEESVRSAATFVEGVLEASSDPMAVLDADLRVRMASPAFVELLLPHEGWKSRPLTDFAGASTRLDSLRTLAAADGEPTATPIPVTLQATNGGPSVSLFARALQAFDAPSNRIILLTAPAAVAFPRRT